MKTPNEWLMNEVDLMMTHFDLTLDQACARVYEMLHNYFYDISVLWREKLMLKCHELNWHKLPNK